MTQTWGAPTPRPQMPSYQSWGQPVAWGAPPPPPPPPDSFTPGYPQPLYGAPGNFAPPPPPTPRKRGNPLLAILGGLAFVLILGFFVVALSNYLNGGGGGGGGGNDPSYHQVDNVPAPDYNPPAIPQPKTYEQATTWLEKNALYKETVPVPTNCTVPYLDPTTASTTQLEDHLNQLTACLWGVWEGPMTKAGFQLPRPPSTVYTTAITTPCGKADLGNAFYCGADQHIYYAKNLPSILPPKIRTKPFVTDAIMAHEFGHAIQARTGILISDKAWEEKAGEAEGRVFSRRTEVQADCFAGLWVNAVAKASNLTSADFENLKFLFYNIGDDVLTGEPNYDGDHGLSKNREAWVTIGLSTDQIGKCNSYVAPKDSVR